MQSITRVTGYSGAVLLLVLIAAMLVNAQSQAISASDLQYRIGERLTYSVTYDNFQNAVYFETYVASGGKFRGRDAIELRARLKTFELVSAAVSLIDERRTVFVDPGSGLPLFVTRLLKDGPIPKEIKNDYLATPTDSFDLLSLIYKIRAAGGNGSFSLNENGEVSIITAQTSKVEKLTTEAGEFDTVICKISGSYFQELGIQQVIVNLSSDEFKYPVLIRIKAANSLFRAELAGINIDKPVTPAVPTPKPPPVSTQRPTGSPNPPPTPVPYVDDQPLLPELLFSLGETLEYKVSSSGVPVASIRLRVDERRLFQAVDSLKLTAVVTGIEQGNTTFALGDSITTQVDPITLVPRHNEMKFAGTLKTLNQVLQFDQKTGVIITSVPMRVDAPIGTHGLLSMVYAMRSFNLKPSKDPTNPVNDTRVAVFWDDRPYVFTLRPANEEQITIGTEKVAAQLVSINTGNPQLDQLSIKVWLSTDERRVPLRFSMGSFIADLTSVSETIQK